MNLSYYELLEIPETATHEEIKQQYQKLLLIHHPDKSQSSLTNSEGMNKTEKVNQIIEAWKILKDPELRKVYDKELKATKLRHDGLFNSEIDLDDMEYDQETNSYSIRCRCGGLYIITEENLDQGADIIGCTDCSLRIRVLYEAVSEH
ncbi:DNAJ heat shock N-terminal domain-containing protein [Gigaspora margarita]|uniref:Diphthamide biosynthesis protein 4 n=1 Tax=Gigaspora margarita TaxID=4874 RepID=A0A8H3XGM4_GIGMA|nr:DNAJ heat shock N-terminal domain-containing protein [Gigaspora margarita]